MSRIKPIGVSQSPVLRVRQQVVIVILLGLMASLFTSRTAFATSFPVHRLSGQCSGHLFDAQPDDATQAKNLMAGKLRFTGFRVTKLVAHPTWRRTRSATGAGRTNTTLCAGWMSSDGRPCAPQQGDARPLPRPGAELDDQEPLR